MRIKTWALIAFLALSAADLAAWGKQGQRIVALIAKSQVSAETVNMVDYYLKGQSWEEAMWWLDEELKTRPATARWHQVLTPKDKTYVPVKTPNLLNELELNIRLLENRSLLQVKDISNALRIIFHLVSDLHQPLNCGYTEDKGGEDFMVDFSGKKTSLAEVWNEELIAANKTDLWDCTKILMDLPQKEKNDIQKLNPIAWMEESRKILPQVYALNANAADAAYVTKNKILVETQLVKAGLRLAAILNKMFKE